MRGRPKRPAVFAVAALAAVLAFGAPCAAATLWPSATTPSTVALYNLPDYQPSGIALGSFTFLPQISEMASYDDDIFASDQFRGSDDINTTQETLAFDSQWSHNALSGQLISAQQVYDRHPTESANTFGGNVSGRLDIDPEDFLQLDLDFLQQPEARGSPEASTGLAFRPIYNTSAATLNFQRQLNRWTEHAQASYTQIAYLASADIGRDSATENYVDRVSYQYTDPVSLYVEGSDAEQLFRINRGDRNYDSQTLVLGTSLEVPTVIKGEIGVGVLRQAYQNAAFKTLFAPTVTASLIWNVLPLTSIVGSVDRTVTGTETSCDPASLTCATAAGIIVPEAFTGSNVKLRNTRETTVESIAVQHEIWHNLLGEQSFRYERDIFDFNGLVDDTYELDSDLRYLMNRIIEIDFDYAHRTRTANLPFDRTYNSGPYIEDVFSMTVKATF